MFRNRMRLVIVLVLILPLWSWPVISAKTWHLRKGQDFKALSTQSQDKYLLAVAEIKKLVNTGQANAVRKALDKLKKDFPEIAGPDLDAFIEAEILFCKGKFAKAARAYDKFLVEYPESGLYEAVLAKQFAVATAFLAGEKKPILKIFKIKGYAEGTKIMERISDQAGQAPISVKATVAVADSFERRGKFNEAYHKWSIVSSRWPTGQTGKDALLAMGRCKHAAYKGPKYDVSNLISAKSYYENFSLRYPQDAEKFEIGKRLELINEQMALKQFRIGEYYQKTDNRQPANFYYQMVIDNWPGTIAAKMARTAMNEKKPSGKEGKKWQENITKKLGKLFL